MRAVRILSMRLRTLFHRDDVERELLDEFRDHLDRETEAGVARGLSPAEARCAARRALNGAARYQEECRDARGLLWAERIFQDLRFALRSMRKNLGFTTAVVAVLAFGVGSTTAVFSIVNAVLLRPLAVPDADRLLVLRTTGEDCCAASEARYNHWRSLGDALESVSAFYSGVGSVDRAGTKTQLPIIKITADGFRAFGLSVVRGRNFTEEEARPGGPEYAVVSDRLVATRFWGTADMLGGKIVLDGTPRTVIGVVHTDPEMREYFNGVAPDIFVPFRIAPQSADLASYFGVVARVKPGVATEQAVARLRQSTAGYAAKYPKDLPLKGEFSGETLRHTLVAGHRALLLILLGAVGLVTLIACTNAASLLLARGQARSHEIAVRVALGAGQSRVIGQLLTESVLLFCVAGALGTTLGFGAVRWTMAIHDFRIPLAGKDGAGIWLDWRVAAFALGLSLLTGIVFGLFPAAAAARDGAPQGARTTASRREGRARAILVGVEIATAVVLLVGSTLLIRTFVELYHRDRGFESSGVLAIRVPMTPNEGTNMAAIAGTLRRGLEAIRGLPGVAAAGATWCCVPLEGTTDVPFEILGKPETDREVGWATITPGLLDVFRVPLKRGRGFTDRDEGPSPPVAIVNERMAREFWPNADPVGTRIVLGKRVGGPFLDEPVREIVGVVGDVRDSALEDEVRPIVYVPIAQMPETEAAQVLPVAPMSWLVHTVGRAENVVPAVQEELRRVTGTIGADAHSMDDSLAKATSKQQLNMQMMTAFGLSALALAAIGIYGLMAYSVERGRREMGIRLALGADGGRLSRSVLKRGLGMALAGTGIGLVAAWALSRVIASFLFGVSAHDPLTYAGAAVAIFLVAAAACWIPARRASSVDPAVALRME